MLYFFCGSPRVDVEKEVRDRWLGLGLFEEIEKFGNITVLLRDSVNEGFFLWLLSIAILVVMLIEELKVISTQEM